MEIVADLHLHSKYSRAVSQNMNLQTMAAFARQKGIDLLTTGDWTHPLWFKEITSLLEEEASGIYRLKSQIRNSKSEINPNAQNSNIKTPKFLLSTEISLIYKQGEKVRRIHNLVFAPNIETAEKINQTLINRGANLHSDGRPIIGMTCHDLLELILSIDQRCLLIPCHVWTPHFGVYGSASGFDSLTQAFGDLAQFVYGIETGLSSDPDMNWQIPELDNRSILSFSDAHSAPKMGRELTVFVENKNGISNDQYSISNFTYEDICTAIKQDSKAKLKIGYTIEFYPEEGKYHYSGHRNCKVSYGPEDIKKNGNICPICHRRLTEGVLVRVQELSGSENVETAEKKQNAAGLQWFVDPNHKHPPYVKLVPLLEIVAESLGSTVSSQKSQTLFAKLCTDLQSELHVLLKASIDEIKRVGGEKVAQGVQKVRAGSIVIVPGFDGEYGKVRIWDKQAEEKAGSETSPQLRLDF